MRRVSAALLALALWALCLPAQASGGRSWTSWARRNWIPRDVATCAYWTDANLSKITIATGISVMSDMSGNGRDLTNATTTKQPVLTANVFGNLSAALYDGSNDFLLAGGANIGTTFTRFVVGKYAASGSAGTLFDGDAAGGGNQGRLYRASTTSLHLNVGAEVVATTTPQSAHVYMVVNTPGTNASSLDIDGTTIGTATASGQAVTQHPIQGTFGDTASDPANGYIADDLEYSSVLSAADIARIKFYLKATYGTP